MDRTTGEWRIRTNGEIWTMYNEPLITQQVKMRIMRWAGHVARASEEDIIKKIFNLKYDQKRRVGRPRKRWLDNVQKWYADIQDPSLTAEWTEAAQDRQSWRALIAGGFGPPRPV